MINKDSSITEQFVEKIFMATKRSDYVACSLSSIKTEENMKKIIQWIDNNPNVSLSEIEMKIMEITGIID